MVSKRGRLPGGKSVDNRTMAGADKFGRRMMQQARGNRQHNNQPLIEVSEMQNSGLMTRGAVLLLAGLLVLVALVLLAVQKRQLSSKADEQFHEFKDEAGGSKEDLDGNKDPDNSNTDADS